MFLVAGISLPATSCQKPAAAPEPVVAHVEQAPSLVGTTQTILEKTFPLKTSATFPFEIPAHVVRPHLHGVFQSFAGQAHGISDESANLDFLVMNEEQNTDFAGGGSGEALFSVEASHNQVVNFDLPAALGQPVKYYLVFRNPGPGGAKKVVEANFRVDF